MTITAHLKRSAGKCLHHATACLLLMGLAVGCGDPKDGNDNVNQNGNNTSSLCGNGTVEGVEECDEGAANSDSLADACRTSCQAASCGDGVGDSGEQCDEGPQNSDRVPNACRPDCTLPACGDAVVDTLYGEGCDCGDGSVEVPQSCNGPNSDAEGSVCLSDCRIAGCGDGVVHGLEQCDGTELGGASCTSLGFYSGGDLGCTSVCLYDTVGCQGYCGDGVRNGPEHCDGNDLGGYSCHDIGFQAGPLGCTGYCLLDTSGCKVIGWEPMVSTTNTNLYGVSGTSASNIYAVASNFGVFHYDGQAWSLLPGWPSTRYAHSVFASPDGSVYASGGGWIYRFNGTSWEQAKSTSNLYYAAWGSSSTNIWFAGTMSEGGIATWARYNGTSWSEGSMGTMSQATGVWGVGSTVWVVGLGGKSYRYNGTSWGEVTTTVTTDLNAVWGTSTSNVYAVGDGGVIIRFNGTSWSSNLNSGYTSDLFALWGSAADDLYAMGASGATHHFDGYYWSSVSSGSAVTMRGLWGLSPDFHIAVGDSGQIRRGNGMFWHWGNMPAASGELSQVWGRNDTDVYALSGTNVLHFNGTSWTTQAPCSATGATWRDVWASSATNAFLVGTGGNVCRYTGDWASMTSGVSTELRGLWGSASDHVIAVGDGGVIRHFNGTGSWTAMTSPTTERLDAVWGSGSTDAFAVGWNGTLLRYAGGIWTQMTSPTTSHLHAVWGTSTTDVFAAGDGGTLLHYDGAQWTQAEEVFTTAAFWDLWGSSATDVFAVGDGSTIYHFDGATWAPVLSPSPVSFSSAWGQLGSYMMFVGGDRLVWLNYPVGL